MGSSFADFTNQRVQVAKVPFQTLENAALGSKSGHFGGSKSPNVESANY
jgi:hypothetical protein